MSGRSAYEIVVIVLGGAAIAWGALREARHRR